MPSRIFLSFLENRPHNNFLRGDDTTMPINKTKLFRAIFNANAYLYSIKLPFEQPIEQVLDNILTTNTLPIYSVFSPLVESFALNVSELTPVREYDQLVNTNNTQVAIAREYTTSNAALQVNPGESGESWYWNDKDKIHMKGQDRNANTYFLPDEVLRYNLMDISAVYHDRNRTSDTDIAYTWYRGSMLELIPAVVDTIAYSQMIGAMGIHERFDFFPPNKLYLRGYFDNIIVKARFEHRNLMRMSMAEYNQLFTLFNYDVRVFVYNLMISYDGTINGAYGAVNLKIEHLANAESERAEYIKSLDAQLASSNIDWVDFL